MQQTSAEQQQPPWLLTKCLSSIPLSVIPDKCLCLCLPHFQALNLFSSRSSSLCFQGIFKSFQQRGHTLVLHEGHGRSHHSLWPRPSQWRLQQVLQDRRKTHTHTHPMITHLPWDADLDFWCPHSDCLSSQMKGCIKVLKDQPADNVEGLLNALKYVTPTPF